MSDMRDLRLFVAATTHGGFRGAARATSSPASTVNEAVRRLEDRLGVRLMNRTTRAVALTPAGAELLERNVSLSSTGWTARSMPSRAMAAACAEPFASTCPAR